MRYLTLILAIVVVTGIPAGAATCSTTGTCRACKNCKYCKACSKLGASCSVCRKKDHLRAAAQRRHAHQRV